jgi:hypothetical protein
MRTSLAVATTGALLTAYVGLAAPASAACDEAVPDSCTTGVTAVAFDVAQGTLTITTTSAASGAPAALGSSGARATIVLGASTVKDTRITPTGWSVSATASDFVTASGKIAKGRAMFSVQPGWTAPTGMTLPSLSADPSTTPLPVDANGSRTLMTASAGATNTGITYTPVLTVVIPPNSAAGSYTGTVTQSVA